MNKDKNLLKQLHNTAMRVGHTWQPPKPPPDEAYGELFTEAQLRRVHEDGMTLVDAVPTTGRRRLLRAYELAKRDPDFDLAEFIQKYYPTTAAQSDPDIVIHAESVQDHIQQLWPVLTRSAPANKGSLIALPSDYVVPGGRFTSQYYWDSYFIILGLDAAERWDMIEGMMRNYRHMISKFGYIPTANRTYQLSRSQPPYFAHMVRLMAHKFGKRMYARSLPFLIREYSWWMRGGYRALRPFAAYRRVARMPDGILLNRYYDDKNTPRPESYREDVETAELAGDRDSRRVYRDLRAAAESGWDFSCRWFADPQQLETIRTTDVIPVDLNCLMYDLEMAIVAGYQAIKQPLLAKRYKQKAEKRAQAIRDYFWDDSRGFFCDIDRSDHGHSTGILSLAGVYPLYSNIATPSQAAKVAERLEKDFLAEGGLVSTLITNGQQWDSPNGWAPLHWTAIRALRRYGFNELADEIKRRWIDTCMYTYNQQSKLVEKYDVVNPHRPGGGGEYPLQDGFGWTNGVLIALLNDTDHDRLGEV